MSGVGSVSVKITRTGKKAEVTPLISLKKKKKRQTFTSGTECFRDVRFQARAHEFSIFMKKSLQLVKPSAHLKHEQHTLSARPHNPHILVFLY